MKTTIILALVSFFNIGIVFSQQSDTIKAKQFEQKAKELFDRFKYDSAANYYKRAAEIYEKEENWLNCVRDYRLMAESYTFLGEIDSAFNYSHVALEKANAHLNNNLNVTISEKVNILAGLSYLSLEKNDFKSELKYSLAANKLIDGKNNIDKNIVAKVWNNLGIAYFDNGQEEKGVDYCKKSLELREKLFGEDYLDNANNLFNLGDIYRLNGNYKKSLSFYNEALKIRIKKLPKNHPLVSRLYNKLALIHRNLGDLEKAMIYIERAIKSDLKIFGKSNKSLIDNYDSKATIYRLKGDFEKAIIYYQKVLKDATINYGPNHLKVASAYKGIAVICKSRGEYDKSLEFYHKALQTAKKIFANKGLILASYYQSVGIAYYFKKDFDNALFYYRKAESLVYESYKHEHVYFATIYNNIAYLYFDLRKINKAKEYYEKALQIRLKKLGDNHYFVATSYNNLGLLYFTIGKYDKALDYYKKALRIRKNKFGKHHNFIALSNNNIGRLYLETNNFSDALNYYQKSIMSNIVGFNDSVVSISPNKFNALSKPYLLDALAGKAETFYAIYKKNNQRESLIKAIENYDLFYKLINEMRGEYNHESNQLILSENAKGYYMQALLAGLSYEDSAQNKKKGKAFKYLEQSKSATLNAYLNETKIKSYLNIADSLLEKERKIAVNRRFYETSIQKAKTKKTGYDTLQVQKNQDLLFGYSRQYDSLINTLKTEYPDYYKLKYEQKVASIDKVKEKLGKKEALLNYFVADTMLFIAALNKDTVVYKTIKVDSLFNQQIIDYHIDIKSVFSKDEIESSTDLYNYLIKPVEGIIENKNNLVIIPDGNLYYIPFETLCRSKTTADLTKPNYLIKNHTISYHQSATLWLNSLGKSKEKETGNENFLGFAPVFDPKINNGYILSSKWISDTTDIELATRSISSDLKHLNALPYSEKEINAILKLFKKKNKKGIGYIHQEATEENFKQKSKDYKYLHIASHSFTNDKYPALSGIAFSQPDTTSFDESKNDDGILYAGESYNLNLSNADLVVLSSCKSGLGKLVKGEGFLSLSRGFLYAGVPNIIFSLWNVKDEPTKDLMVHFYKQVLKEKSYAEALRDAKLKLISNPKTAAPKYWAAWTLVGR